MFTLTGKHQHQTKNIFHHQILCPSQYWALPEKKIHGLIKNNVEFPGVIKKNHVKFPGILVLGLEISEGCNTILWSFQGSSFVLSGIFRGKVKTLKTPGDFPKKYVLNHFGKLGRENYEKTFWSGADFFLPEKTIKSRK